MRILITLTMFLIIGCTQNTYNINVNSKNTSNHTNSRCSSNCNGDCAYDGCSCGCDIQWTDPDLIDDF